MARPGLHPQSPRRAFGYDHFHSINRSSLEAQTCLRLWYGSLSLACVPTLHRIAIPYLYADLIVGSSAWIGQTPRYLHRSCRENPLLWTFCRRLTVYYQEPENGYLYAATDFITWFTSMKYFALYGLNQGGEHGHCFIWHLSVCLAVLGSCLGVTYSYGLDLPRVINVLGDFEQHLSRISELDWSLCQTNSKKSRNGPIYQASITLFYLDPEKTLEALVRWPKTLEAFEFKFSFGDDHSHRRQYTEWTLSILPILAIRRRALRSIKIYARGISRLAGLDLRDFESLSELSPSSACTRPLPCQRLRDQLLYKPSCSAPSCFFTDT